MQRTMQAAATSGQHPWGVLPRTRVQWQSQSAASSGSSQVQRHQYRSFMPRCSQGASSTDANPNAAASGPNSSHTASAASSSAA